FDWPRRDSVDAYPVASPFDGEIARQRVHARLRSRNVKLHRRAEIVKCRADIQDLTAMLFQLVERRATHVERTFQVDVDNGAEAVRRQLFSVAQKVAGRAVDDEVDLSQLLDRRR